MSIQDEFKPYKDGNGLMAPSPVPLGVMRGSDNGPMFTSEYFILLERNEQAGPEDDLAYINSIKSCITPNGYLHRAPDDPTQDAIDDYLGVLAAFEELGLPVSLGSRFRLPLPLWRFPQLVYVYLLNKGVPSLLMFPLIIITAIILATSCLGTPINQADPRRLNWLLWQATKRKSRLCDLSGKSWYKRQQKAYGSEQVMSRVAGYYYQPYGLDMNPYSKYWKD